jgi:hypothetical protein
MNYLRTYISHLASAVIALVLFSAFAAFAWTGPTQAPPNGNASAPINVGSADQIKVGGISVGAISVYGGALVTGNVTAAGFFHSSDANLKENVQTIGGVALISKLRGVSFDWKKDGSHSMGVIAQEVEAVLPSAVRTGANGTKYVEYDQLIAPLIEAIKEQQAQIDELKKEIEALKAR